MKAVFFNLGEEATVDVHDINIRQGISAPVVLSFR